MALMNLPAAPLPRTSSDGAAIVRAIPFLTGDMFRASLSDATRLALIAISAVVLAGCGPSSTPTFFIPPTDAAPLVAPPAGVANVASPTALLSTPLVVPAVVSTTPTPPCSDGLTYVQDLTVPDGTNFSPGQAIDKQWLVSNSGTCDWDEHYRLKLIGGDALGAASLLALYPARAGTQATIRIIFTAPQQSGLYQSQWQAMNPDGLTFGDVFYIQIAVTP